MSEKSQIDNEMIAQLQLAKQRFEEDNLTPSPKIQRIHSVWRRNAKFVEHCTPMVISFGPIHHGDKYFEQGEQYKLQWTAMYIEEYSKQTNQVADQVAQSLLKTIKDNLGELKKLFTDDAIGRETTDEDLARMFFVDGCSLLYFMEHINRKQPETLKLKLVQMTYIWKDIIMLENQLPRRLLELLIGKKRANLEYLMDNFFHMGIWKRQGGPSLEQSASSFPSMGEDREVKEFGEVKDSQESSKPKSKPNHLLDHFRTFLTSASNDHVEDRISETCDIWKRPGGPYLEQSASNFPSMGENREVKEFGEVKVTLESSRPKSKPNHLLDRFRTFLKSASNNHVEDRTETCDFVSYKNIRDLKAAGIQVKANKTDGWRWSSVSFTSKLFHGELRLPKFMFDTISPYFFRNLVAYEMCPDFHNNLECCIYFWFMNSLIESGEDVKELRLAGVIVNYLGCDDEELAKVFKDLIRDLPVRRFGGTAHGKNYVEVRNQIQKHYTNKWKTIISKSANKYNVYFNGPWSVLAFLAALAALALTAVQTWYCVHPNTP